MIERSRCRPHRLLPRPRGGIFYFVVALSIATIALVLTIPESETTMRRPACGAISLRESCAVYGRKRVLMVGFSVLPIRGVP